MNSLYIQITDRCNMTCEHCCFACTKKGSDMSVATFNALMGMVSDDESCLVTIGGGEPTLHKHCMDFVWQAVRATLSASENMGSSILGIVTNGSVEKSALELARMARNGFISARLSYDNYHDLSMVSDRVRNAFKVAKNELGRRADDHDLRAINQHDYFITPHGRALENGIYNHPYQTEDSCCCDGLFVVPNGTIYQCGCRLKVLGTVNDIPAFWEAYDNAVDRDSGEIPCSKKLVDKSKEN